VWGAVRWWAVYRWTRQTVRSSEVAALESLMDDNPMGVSWHSAEETRRLLGMMNQRNLDKVSAALASGKRLVGTVYKQTRLDEDGVRRQRAEVRFDGVAGCLRTPAADAPGGRAGDFLIEDVAVHVTTATT
jgi:DNA (cytosine-5)-methyltransferase 1